MKYLLAFKIVFIAVRLPLSEANGNEKIRHSKKIFIAVPFMERESGIDQNHIHCRSIYGTGKQTALIRTKFIAVPFMERWIN